MARFKQGQAFVCDEGVAIEGSFGPLADALQGRPYDSDHLLDLLREDAQSTVMPWGSGRLGALAGLVHVQAARAQGQPIGRDLEEIARICHVLKAGAVDEQVSTDQLLLEDLSVVLFRRTLGTGKRLDVAEMNPDQRCFLDVMSHVYQGHTYALLHAGVAPRAAGDVENLGLTSSIYHAV